MPATPASGAQFPLPVNTAHEPNLFKDLTAGMSRGFVAWVTDEFEWLGLHDLTNRLIDSCSLCDILSA